MGLEAPLALLGLLAGLLPLIAHRVRRRDLPHRSLPTTRLLQRAVAAQRAKRSLADLLLLCLRVLLVVAACLAVAAPYVTARVAFGDGQVGSASIVIDDSLSMMRRDGGERLLSLALSRAREAIDALPDGSEVSVVLGGTPARILVPRTRDLAAAARALSSLPEESHRAGDLQTAANLALQQLAAGRHARRHLLLLSDFAIHCAFDPEALQLGGARLQMQRVGAPPTTGNVAIVAATAASDPTAPGQTSVAFELRAYGDAPARVGVRAGDSDGEAVDVPLVKGAGRGTLHVPTPEDEAEPVVTLQLQTQDALPEDDHRELLLDGRQALDVLLVNGDPHPASAEDELWYARHALRLASDAGLPVRLSSIDAQGLRGQDLSGTDVLLLANLPAPSGPTAQHIEAFVRAGGGLLVTGGDNLVPQRYNARLRGILPAHIAAVERHADTGLAADAEGGSAAHASVLGAEGLDRVAVRQRLLLETREHAVLLFADGLPAVARRRVGRGMVALLATTIDDGWCDLPYRPGFVPLLIELLRSVAGRSVEASRPLQPGAKVDIPVPPGATHMEIVTPAGFRHAYEDLNSGDQITFEDTLLAGVYRVLVAGPDGPMRRAPAQMLTVELPASEADLTPAPLANTWPGDTPRTAGATVKRDLSPFGFLLVGLLVVGEALMRRRRRR